MFFVEMQGKGVAGGMNTLLRRREQNHGGQNSVILAWKRCGFLFPFFLCKECMFRGLEKKPVRLGGVKVLDRFGINRVLGLFVYADGHFSVWPVICDGDATLLWHSLSSHRFFLFVSSFTTFLK